MSITVNVSKTYTNQDIVDIFTTAIEGGINYWCSRYDVPKNMDIESFITDEDREEANGDLLYVEKVGFALANGGKVKFLVDENNDGSETKWYTLTISKLKRGIGLYTKIGSANPEDWDATSSDCIIQYALFGELVFS